MAKQGLDQLLLANKQNPQLSFADPASPMNKIAKMMQVGSLSSLMNKGPLFGQTSYKAGLYPINMQASLADSNYVR